MVQFGKFLKQCRRHGWEDAYLDYKKLKKIVSVLERQINEYNTKQVVEGMTLSFFDGDSNKGNRSSNNNISVEHNTDLKKEQDSDDEEDEENQETKQRNDLVKVKTNKDAKLGVMDGTCNGIDQSRELFFKELGREVEKISLFVLTTQGQLSDAVGALRFGNDRLIADLFQKEHDNLFKTLLIDTNKDVLQQYLVLGVELLYLLQFVGVNTIAVRKILKKYNKAVQNLDDPKYQYFMGSKYDVHLQQVANFQSVAAIEASLQSALVQFFDTDQSLDTNHSRNLNYFRFQSIIQASYMIRKNSEIVNQPFNDFLSRKAMIFTGSNLGGIESSAMRAMDNLLRFDPTSMLSYDEAQLESLWIKWLPQYGNWKSRRAILARTEDWSHLSNPTEAAMALLESEETDWLITMKEGFYHPKGSAADVRPFEQAWGGVDTISMIINLLSILLYTINYYIVAPTANHYALILGTDGAFGATLIGASSFSAIFAAFLYSLWYTKATFKSVLIFSTICPLVGNLIYALAISYHSMKMALIGRILCGFGSAEVVNRQLISTCVSFSQMTRASAFFVAFGAMGMSIGPLMAAILDNTAGRDLRVDLNLPFTPAGGIVFNHVTSPGFIMSILWFVEMLALVFLFSEPHRINGSAFTQDRGEDDDGMANETTPLAYPGQSDLFTEKRGSVGESTISTSTDWSQSQKRSVGIWQELHVTWTLFTKNSGLWVTLLVFCFIELADELLISSCSMVVRRYFGWHGSAAGFLIAALGSLVLPANFVVENFSHRISERRIMKFSMWFIIFGLFGILNYQGMYYDIVGVSTYGNFDPDDTSDLQSLELSGENVGHLLTRKSEFPYDWGGGHLVYIIFLSVVFMGTIVLEGVVTSIMAQVTPAQLNSCVINSGLLATLIGTLGRVLSDSMITFSALLDIHVFVDFINATFFPLLLLAFGSLWIVYYFYSQLV